jgi:two-component system, LytTR family, response regulator
VSDTGAPAGGALRVLIVDDEPLARRGLRLRLERLGAIDIVGECASGGAAVAAIEEGAPDVVLLDVQMPELDGFDVVEAVGVSQMPVTIFVTAYDAHAIRAFEAHALDYLLKPLDDDRFAQSIERARVRVAERNDHARSRALGAAIADPIAPRRRIVLRERGRVLVLEHKEIDWIGAEGDYVRVHAAGRSHLFRNTMSAMEERLDPAEFARIHRSTIVNVAAVREVRTHGDRHWVVVLRDRTRLKMSRVYRSRLPIP